MWRPCKAYMTVTYATRLNNPGTLKLNTKRPKTTEPENEKVDSTRLIMHGLVRLLRASINNHFAKSDSVLIQLILHQIESSRDLDFPRTTFHY